MGGPDDAMLEAAFAQYCATQAALRGRVDPPLHDIEAALVARVELFRCLVETGWKAPEPVARQIDQDALLMDQPHGALGG